MKYYYCLHNCIINNIECIEGVCLTLDEWNIVLENPQYDISFNKFFFAEVPTKHSKPTGKWGNGGKCNDSLQPELDKGIIDRFIESTKKEYPSSVPFILANQPKK